MNIILQNKDNLRFTTIYLFKNGKCIQILDNINYLKTVEQILNIDPTTEYIIVNLPRTGARLHIIDSLNNNEDRNFKFFLYDHIPLRLDQMTIGRKPNGEPLYCIGRTSDTEADIMKTILNEIESTKEEQ